jgi:hypothetical protein
MSTNAWAVIIGPDGEYRWWWNAPETIMMTRVRLSADRRWIYHLSALPLDPENPILNLYRVSITGEEYEAISDVEDPHHDFVLLSDNTIAVLEHDYRTIDGTLIRGDRLVEITPTGERRVVWSAWDHINFDGQFNETYLDWIHANALDYIAAEDAYYISLSALGSIWKIDRQSGTVLQKIGGDVGSYQMESGEIDLFRRQHQFEPTDLGVLVFDNGSIEELSSRIIEYHLDLESDIASEHWSYQTEPPLYCPGLGDVSRLENGHTRVTWGSAGQIDEVDQQGELIWRINTDLGGILGYVTWETLVTEQ